VKITSLSKVAIRHQKPLILVNKSQGR